MRHMKAQCLPPVKAACLWKKERQPPKAGWNGALPPLEILRAFATFRFILPKAQIRTAGGREVNLRDLQSLALNGGASGIMIGGYLTTAGRGTDRDMQMLKDLGRPRSVPNLDI